MDKSVAELSALPVCPCYCDALQLCYHWLQEEVAFGFYYLVMLSIKKQCFA